MADYETPKDLRYTQEDEWLREEGDLVVIGVTDYAQAQLGDVVFVEMPEVGSTITRGEPFGVIESVKAVSDLYAPITGEVKAVNDALEDQPELVNGSCYTDGWILQIAPLEWEELDGLLDSNGYETYVEERAE